MNVFTGDSAVSFQFIIERMTNPELPLFYLLFGVVILILVVWLGEWALSYYCKRRRWELLLAGLARERTSPSITPFSSSTISWGENLTLQLCPDFPLGWKIDAIELRFLMGGHPFALPRADQTLYSQFRKESRSKRWYQRDMDSCRLAKNPVSFSDSPRLTLEVQQCKYSQAQYTNHRLAPDQHRKQDAIRSILRGDIPFANVFVIHAVIISDDDQLLGTEASMKKDYFGGCWSFSIEEQLRVDDMSASDVYQRVGTWMKRALREELGVVEPDDYVIDNIRVLSVFIEGHNLNCGLCCVARLSIDAAMLSAIISAKPRQDYEFTDYRFFSIDEAIEMLRYPTLRLHPTSEYRLFLALSWLLTPPKLARRLFRQEEA
ncbi:hypothetical protein HLB44_36285 [Aquincola sp. S2]|uniref:Uncharacterized protein n=1 Tax=Pseudaquabacterium terrae TaxID=2732868 RepID=A0ABX2EUT4_9BURK|nr:hypothetical protein [Aquabacterium terrae]NRF72423.1 hypothetical protein [Aquabacterium terrae]